MVKPWHFLQSSDPTIYNCLENEFLRQNNSIELIASENFASQSVIASMANVLTNKYAEGRPRKRYYGGCEFVDELEEVTITRACHLFGCQYANVQPHSGAQANAAVLLALAKPGSKLLGLDLTHGGHLTHGSKVNFSGIYYESHFYSVNEASHLLDYDKIQRQAEEIKPAVIIAGASAYPRIIDFKRFRHIADSVGAYLLVDMSHIAGLVVAKLHPDPIPHAHVVTSTTHKTLRGPRGGVILWNDDSLSASLNKGVFPGTQGGPLEHIVAAKAVAFKEAAEDSFREYQQNILKNTKSLVHYLKAKDFCLVSEGSDNHLILVDLSKFGVSGKSFEEALEKVGITVNKNTVPNEKRSPFVTSGIRIGTPAVTSRGMQDKEMKLIADYMRQTIDHIDDESVLHDVKMSILTLTKKFPLYPDWS